MTIDEAYDFLGVRANERGQMERLKARFRKMCLKWHPDKNIGREMDAAVVFQAVHAAYHFLTTNNFDYKRWKTTFTVPPMQSLEEVLMMALSGEDPYQIEELLRKRGEYRPHRDFGVNLSIPWNAGGAEDPSYDVSSGSAYSTTRKLADGSAPEGEQPLKIGSTEGADDEAYAAVIDGLVGRGADLSKLRRMALADANGSELKMELRRLGYTKLGERARTISALKAAAAGRIVRRAGDGLCGGNGPAAACDGASSAAGCASAAGASASPADGSVSSHAVALNASEQALLGELAVVEAPRVRQLGLYETHSDAFIERFGEQARLGGNDEARPWEASALGRPVHEQSPAPYVRARSYTSISATHERAAEFAEKANEQAMEGYRAKNYQLCYDAASEAIRLNPTKVVYLGNRAAAALKLRGQAHLRQAVEDCTRACALDPSYVKGYVRSAGAHLAMGEPHTVQLAIELYERARQLDPTDRSIEHALENARMLYASDYAR